MTEFNLSTFGGTTSESTDLPIEVSAQKTTDSFRPQRALDWQEDEISEMVIELNKALSGELDSPVPTPPETDNNRP